MEFQKKLIGLQKIILLFIPIFLTSCGSSTTYQNWDGSKIKINKKNVYCEVGEYYRNFESYNHSFKDPYFAELKCHASGVKTTLNGARYNYYDNAFCVKVNKKIEYLSEPNNKWFPCRAALKFKLLKK